MSTNPPGPTGTPPPGDNPPAPPPAPASPPPDYSPPSAYPQPEGYPSPAEPAAAPAYPGAPSYPTPGYGVAPPVAGAPSRRTRNVIAVLLVVVLVVVAIIGYGIAGFAFASSRIESARTAYNEVIAHQNSLADTFNTFSTQVQAINLTNVTAAQLKQAQGVWDLLGSKSQAASPTIAADEATLATAQAKLKDNEWLTVFSRSRLDQTSNRIGHERKALAAAKTITADFVQIGAFYHSFFDAEIDLETLGTKLQEQDISGSVAADATLKSDLTKTLPLAGAPGLPAEVHQYLLDLQSLAVDFEKLLDALQAGDASGLQAAANAATADAKKVDAYDWTKIGAAIDSFYQPLIDSFNSEVTKANQS